MEHLLNCHGELAVLLGFFSSMPVLGVYFKMLLGQKEVHVDA